MSFKITELIKIHRAILTKVEKRRFVLLTLFFMMASILDIVGIGAIGYFLVIMMNPSVLTHLPILSYFLPKDFSNSRTLIILGAIILTAFIIKTIFSCLVQKKLIAYCFTVGARIRVQLMERYLYAPYSYFVSNHTADMINRILNYASNYASLSLVAFMTMIVHTTFVAAITIFLLVVHPFLTLLLGAMFGCMLATHFFMVKGRLYQIGKDLNQSARQIVQSIQEGLSGLKEVRVLGKENFFLNQLKTASVVNAESSGTVSIFQKIPFYLLESVMFIFIITLCLSELSLGMDVQSIIAGCGILVTAGVRLLPSLFQIVSSAVSIQSNQHSLETIHKNLFNYNEEFNNEIPWPKKITSEVPKKSENFSVINVENVSYSYPETSQCTLDNINLTIKKGQSIGIIGASGAGKSTLIDLLLGLLSPTKGKIQLDGKLLHDPIAWISRFAYIPQTIYLLDASIKQNIVLDQVETIDLERLQKALKMAQLEEVIAQLPNGVDTKIGENGVKLSGGQRQRVALARAFYHEREIIVMDEATAALDNETEHEVVEAIKRLHQVKTLIIVAHRYTTVEHCDIIYRLHQGKIVDSGSFREVINRAKSNVSLA